MKIKKKLHLLLLLVVCVWPLAIADGQQTRRARESKSLGYAFVSPNTSEGLSLEQAQAGLNSIEETRLIQEVREVSCKLRQPFQVRKAVGAWSDGAEHSTIIKGRTSESSLRYAGSWLGRFAKQKAILYFRARPTGTGRMFILSLPLRWKSMGTVSNQLEQGGIANRTIARQNSQFMVYIVDLKNELGPKIKRAIFKFGARAATVTGNGEFIGDDDREKAQQIFTQEITNYEKVHPSASGTCLRRGTSL